MQSEVEVIFSEQGISTWSNRGIVPVGDWSGKITNTYDFAKKYNRSHLTILHKCDKFAMCYRKKYNIKNKYYKTQNHKVQKLTTFDSTLELILLGISLRPTNNILYLNGDKLCPKCKNLYPPTLDYFTSDPNTVSGLHGFCKICKAKQDKNYALNNPLKISKGNRNRRLKNREDPLWVENENKKERENRRNDPTAKIKNSMRSSLMGVFRSGGIYKQKHTFDYIGASSEELVLHLNSGEYTMNDYMKNRKGNILFHIDHIIPTKYYLDQLKYDANNNVINTDILYKWWNYRNLRVWPATANVAKGKKLNMELIKKHNIEDLL